MNADFPYRKLPGRLAGWVRKASLWEGPDHVLLVRGTRFQEEYRRFAYRDIQSLQMVRVFRWGSFGWFTLNALLCLMTLPSALTSNAWASRVVFGTLLALLLAQLGRCSRFGCRCYVQTAVSREELPSLIRRRPAHRAFDRLRARILEAQGGLPENWTALLDSSELNDAGTAPLSDQPADDGKSAARSVSLAVLAFVLFLVDAAQTYPSLSGPSANTNWYGSRFVSAALILAMTGAIAGSLLIGLRVRRLKGLRAWVLAALVAEVFDIYVSSFLGSLYTVRNRIADMNMTQFKIWQTSTYADEIALLAVGVGGILFILLKWNTLRGSES